MKSIGGWSKIFSESIQLTFARAKTKIFCLRNDFIIHGKKACVRKSVRTRGMGFGI